MNKYWFKPKRYGYGAYPSTWEGWVLTIGLILFVLLRSLQMHADENIGQFLTEVTILVIIFVFICYIKTDGKWKWRWGNN